MAILPRPSFPVYEITIPSTKKKIKYRPYLAKEEKVLSIAMESEDIAEITNAIKLILQNCIQTKDIDVEKLATFDIEYLFLNIRAKAVGEELELNVLYPSDNENEDEEPIYVKVKINISDIKVQETKGHSNVIKIDDTISIIMRYPTFDYFIKDQFEMPKTNKEKYEKGSDLIASCVDKICKDEEVWLADDVGKEEVLAFLDDLTSAQFNPIEKFIDSMPQLKHTIKIKHPETEVEKEVTLSGIVDFFI